MAINLNKDINLINKEKGMRVRQQDLRNAIHPLNIHKKEAKTNFDTMGISKKQLNQSIKYTIIGQQDAFIDMDGNLAESGCPITDNDQKAMARVDYFNPPKYYIKVDSTGRPYDPIGILTEGTLNKDLKYKKQWEFREVNKKVFNMYLNFLKTKNHLWINNAAREMI